MSENTADFKSTNLEIGFDIGGVRYRIEFVTDKDDTCPIDEENVQIDQENMKIDQESESEKLDKEYEKSDQENEKIDQESVNIDQENESIDQENEKIDQEIVKINQAERHTIKFCAGPKCVSFVRVLLPGGEVEFSKTGENVEEENIIEFANNWIEHVAAVGANVFQDGLDPLEQLGLMNFLEILSYFELSEDTAENGTEVKQESYLVPHIHIDSEKDAEEEGKDTEKEGKDTEDEGNDSEDEGKDTEDEGKDTEEEGKDSEEEGIDSEDDDKFLYSYVKELDTSPELTDEEKDSEDEEKYTEDEGKDTEEEEKDTEDSPPV